MKHLMQSARWSIPIQSFFFVHIFYYLLILQSVPWCKATRIMAKICHKFESHQTGPVYISNDVTFYQQCSIMMFFFHLNHVLFEFMKTLLLLYFFNSKKKEIVKRQSPRGYFNAICTTFSLQKENGEEINLKN